MSNGFKNIIGFIALVINCALAFTIIMSSAWFPPVWPVDFVMGAISLLSLGSYFMLVKSAKPKFLYYLIGITLLLLATAYGLNHNLL